MQASIRAEARPQPLRILRSPSRTETFLSKRSIILPAYGDTATLPHSIPHPHQDDGLKAPSRPHHNKPTPETSRIHPLQCALPFPSFSATNCGVLLLERHWMAVRQQSFGPFLLPAAPVLVLYPRSSARVNSLVGQKPRGENVRPVISYSRARSRPFPWLMERPRGF